MTEIKIKDLADESKWTIKVQAAKRKLTMKDFILRATQYVIDNDIKLD